MSKKCDTKIRDYSRKRVTLLNPWRAEEEKKQPENTIEDLDIESLPPVDDDEEPEEGSAPPQPVATAPAGGESQPGAESAVYARPLAENLLR